MSHSRRAGACGELSDAELLARYYQGRQRPIGTRPHDHLTSCPDCLYRYEHLVRDLTALSDGYHADAAFSAERLATQHRRIMERLERHGRRAAVFAFPTRGWAQRPRRVSNHGPARWVAAAAVVGLAAGLGLGLTIDRLGLGTRLPFSEPRRATPETAAPAVVADAPTAASPTDDPLLDEIDEALRSRRVPELRAYDELTPERVSIVYRTR